MPKLTERRQLQTRTDIAHAAVELFGRGGFDETTMTDVAEAAGVSRRTVYRHFPTKDDLVFEYPRRWLEQLKHEITQRDPDEPLREFSRRVLLELAKSVEEESEHVLAAFAINQATDSLRGALGKSNDLWVQEYIELFMSDPAFTPELLQEVGVVASATNAGNYTAIALWAMGGGQESLPTMITAVLDQLDPIWPRAFW